MKPGNVSVWARSVDLHNVYGPSECTVDGAANVKLKADSNPASIGHGVGALLWITDSSDHNQLAPVGSVGEFLVEGPVVTRGYLARWRRQQMHLLPILPGYKMGRDDSDACIKQEI
jgi:hypothetical protein